MLLLDLCTGFSGQIRWPGIAVSKRFPQFVVIHIVKGFSIVNGAEIGVFLDSSCFLYDPMDVGSLIPVPFLNPA